MSQYRSYLDTRIKALKDKQECVTLGLGIAAGLLLLLSLWLATR